MDLLSARYIRHAFGRHTHETYVVAAITSGVEEFQLDGSMLRAGAGEVALVDPEAVATGHAGVPEGWSYRVLYPQVAEVAEVAAELGVGGGAGGRGGRRAGTLSFTRPIAPDPGLAALVHRVHLAAERDDALAASTAWRLLTARLVEGYLSGPAPVAPAGAGRTAAERARELLASRLADPPVLAELAEAVGARPFPLLRAFRAAYGLPPHAWVTQERVRAARRLLDGGSAPAEAAVAVGFVDQSHLTRHFRRIVGVPPGAYLRGRVRG